MRNCHFCLEPLEIEGEENILLHGEENQIYKSIFECSREFVIDDLKRDISKDWIQTHEFPSPLCSMCFKKSEKVYLVHKQLTETQRQLKKLIGELIIEINSRYSQNLIQYTLKEDEDGIWEVQEPQDVDLSIQQDDVKLSMSTEDESRILPDSYSVEVKEEIFEDEGCPGSFIMKFGDDIGCENEIPDDFHPDSYTTTKIDNSKGKSLRDLVESCENSMWPHVVLKRLGKKGSDYIVPEDCRNSQEKISLSKESVKSRKRANGKPLQTFQAKLFKVERLKKFGYGSSTKREVDCGRCDKKFRSSKLLKAHLAIAHGVRCYFECEICGKKVSTRSNLTSHQLIHSQTREKRHSCEICGTKFYSRSKLNRHRRWKHEDSSGKMKYRCEICEDKFFQVPDSLRSHQLLHHVPYTNEQFHCQQCGQKFFDGIHMFRHSRKKEVTHSHHKCRLCSEKFVTRCDLLIHYSNSHPDENVPDKCHACDLTFNSQIAFQMHVKFCGSIGDFENEKVYEYRIRGGKLREVSMPDRKSSFACRYCRKTLSNKLCLERHEKIHCEPTPCPVCGKVFETVGRMKKHKRFHDSSSDLFSCSVCSTSFKSQNALKLHGKTHKSSEFECDICGKSYLFAYHLKHHKIAVHGDESVKKKKYLCHICGRGYISPKALQVHEQKHNDEKSFMCNQCGICLTTSNGLAKHEMLHRNGEKRLYKIIYEESASRSRYECDLCGKSYTSTENINNHILVKHTATSAELPFPCSECEKRFPSFQKLSVHQKRAHEEEERVCDICGKGFKAVSIKGHMQTHSKEKQMKCEMCGLICSTKANLKRHQRTHTGEKPFQCQLCNKSFSQAETLQNHERIHTGERPFVCHFCGKDFSDRSTWYKHQKSHGEGK